MRGAVLRAGMRLPGAEKGDRGAESRKRGASRLTYALLGAELLVCGAAHSKCCWICGAEPAYAGRMLCGERY
eukprot:1800640-Rhodomonas_salina.4